MVVAEPEGEPAGVFDRLDTAGGWASDLEIGVYSGEERRRWRLKGMGQAEDGGERRVAFAPLHAADVGSVQPSTPRQRFLRQRPRCS